MVWHGHPTFSLKQSHPWVSKGLAFIYPRLDARDGIFGHLLTISYNFFEQFKYPNLHFRQIILIIHNPRRFGAFNHNLFAVAQYPKLFPPIYFDYAKNTNVQVFLSITFI